MASNPESNIREKSVRRRIPKWALQTATAAPSNQQYYLRSIGRALRTR